VEVEAGAEAGGADKQVLSVGFQVSGVVNRNSKRSDA
jgi:hypothetical protein